MGKDITDNCAFCGVENAIDKSRIIYQDSVWMAILDGYPVTKGHTLLIPKRHCATYFDLNDQELERLNTLIKMIKTHLDEEFKPNGYNIGVNCGETAGQTIMHCHIHIIPRYEGDCENPRGGIRGCVPSKMSY